MREAKTYGLAVLAGVLGIGAVVVREPATTRRASVDLAALAKDVEHGADHVAVAELRELVAARKVRVVDLRSPAEFARGHIDGAENVPLGRLAELDARRDEAIVLYSEGGIHSSQAWFLLRARGIANVRFLKGGYDEWVHGADPEAAAGARDDRAEVAVTTAATLDGGAIAVVDAAPATAPAAPPAFVGRPTHAPTRPSPAAARGSEAAAETVIPPAAASAAIPTVVTPADPPRKKPREGC
ncbi:MAG: rhodanese-like domain-containing protein [Polyangiaceae bacterium]